MGALQEIVAPGADAEGRKSAAPSHLREPYYLVDIAWKGGTITGRLDASHLADIPSAQEALMAQLEVLPYRPLPPATT